MSRRAGIGRAGVGHHPRFTFFGYPFSKLYVTFIHQSIAFIFGRDLKRRTGRCFTCKNDNSYFLRYLKNPSIMPLGIILVLYVSEKIKLGILCELPTRQTIHIKCQVLFSLKKIIKKIKGSGINTE